MVSVLMMTYNREGMVSRAIESVLAQTYKDFEYIIVDNGSTDKSGKIAEDYAKKDRRIRVIHRERGTMSAGRNTAISAAKGEYITFLDDDDWIEPDYLAFLVGLIVDNDADISICGDFEKVFDEKKIMTAEQALIEMMWRKRYTICCNAKMFKSKFIKKYKYPENARFDDIAVNYKIFADVNRVAYHGLPKYTFYRHGGNESSWTRNHKLLTASILDEYLDAYRTRTELLSKKFPQSAATFRYFEWSFMISMVEKINRLGIKGCGEKYDYMVSVLKAHRDEFLNCPEIQDFEKQWMEKYIAVQL